MIYLICDSSHNFHDLTRLVATWLDLWFGVIWFALTWFDLLFGSIWFVTWTKKSSNHYVLFKSSNHEVLTKTAKRNINTLSKRLTLCSKFLKTTYIPYQKIVLNPNLEFVLVKKNVWNTQKFIYTLYRYFYAEKRVLRYFKPSETPLYGLIDETRCNINLKTNRYCCQHAGEQSLLVFKSLSLILSSINPYNGDPDFFTVLPSKPVKLKKRPSIDNLMDQIL